MSRLSIESANTHPPLAELGVKLTIELSPRYASSLKELQKSHGITAVGVLRKAIALLHYVDTSLHEPGYEGRRLAIVGDDGRIVKEIVLTP